jgi:hypothetical protein
MEELRINGFLVPSWEPRNKEKATHVIQEKNYQG